MFHELNPTRYHCVHEKFSHLSKYRELVRLLRLGREYKAKQHATNKSGLGGCFSGIKTGQGICLVTLDTDILWFALTESASISNMLVAVKNFSKSKNSTYL